MKNVYIFLYYFLINKIPNSTFPGGAYFNLFRGFFVKKIIKFGSNNTFQKNIYFGNGCNVIIGNNCQINDNVRFDNVKIGDDVMIARDSIFLGKNHVYDRLDISMNKQGFTIATQTIVHNNVWIGLGVKIMPGLVLNSGSVIAAGSVLTKNTVRNGVYAGVPAKLIKIRGGN